MLICREIESNENEPLLLKTQDDTKQRQKYTWTLLLSCLVCSFTGASLGFDVGVMADAIVDIKEEWDLSFFQEELCIGILNIVAVYMISTLNVGAYSCMPFYKSVPFRFRHLGPSFHLELRMCGVEEEL